jgi:hypothetical protein
MDGSAALPDASAERYHDQTVEWLAEDSASTGREQEAAMSVSPRGPAVLKSALQRLEELSRLERDWDTYGALPLTATALTLAEALMRQAVDLLGSGMGERVAPYTLMPIADGGVSIEWRGPQATLELDIGPSGMLSYLLVDNSTGERQFDEEAEVSERQALDAVRRVVGG